MIHQLFFIAIVFSYIELKGITWAQYIDSTSMLWLPSGTTVQGFIPGRAYYLGFGNVIIDQYFIIYFVLIH